MKHLKLFFALFAMLALGVGNAWAEEVSFSFANTTQRVSQDGNSQVWKSGEVVFTNAKGTGNAVVSNTNPIRCYQGSSITIEAPGNISKLVFVCNSSSYATALKNSITSGVSVSGSTVTVTTSGSATYTISSLSAQVRINSLTVTYEAGSTTPKQKYTLTYQAGSATGTLEVEEGANLLDALEDITPVACDASSTEPIGWTKTEISGKQATEPNLLTEESVMPSNDHKVYYVFAKSSAGNVFNGTSGGNFKIYAQVSGTNYYAKGTGSKISSVTNEAEATEYTFTKISDGVFSIKTGSTYITYSSSTNLGTSNSEYKWTISSGTKGSWRIAAETSGRGLVFRASTYNQFGGYSTGNINGTEYFDVEIGSTPSYSDYTTTCGSEEPDTEPTLSVHPAELDFETFKIGSGNAPTKTITITGANLKNNVTLSVAAPFEIQGGNTTLTPTDGAINQEITLVYNPTAGGEHSGTLTITSANSEVESKTVSLTGVAKAPCTVNIYVEGVQQNTTQYYQGDAITFPAVTACVGNAHVGWTATADYYNAAAPTDLCTSFTIPNDQTAVLKFHAVYGLVEQGEDKVDVLNRETTGIANNGGYGDWSEKNVTSTAVYAGQSAGGKNSIQLRHDTQKDPAGIITTQSGGKAKKIVVTWNSETVDGRTLNIYGKNTAYSAVGDLWDGNTNQGTLLGTIVENTSTELEIEGDYDYIGMRSNDGAMYLTSVSITWASVSYLSYSTSCTAAGVEAPTFSKTAGNFTEAFDLTIACETAGATIYYTLDGTDPSAENGTEYTTAFSINKSTVVKAIAIKDATKSNIVSATYLYVNSAATAYTVSEAHDVIDADLGLTNELYVKGTISQVEKYNGTYKSITYWITDGSKQLQVYSGKGLKTTENENGDFASINDLVVGAEVVVCGILKKFTKDEEIIYEFDVNSYLVSYNPPANVEPKAITIDAEIEGGSISIKGNLTEANPGTTIELYYQADDHYTFTSWNVTDENSNPVEVVKNTFTMPESAVTVSAIFTENAKHTLTLVANPVAGGSVKFDGIEGSVVAFYIDETPTIIAEAADGYIFNGWSVSGTASLDNASKATTTVTEFSSDATITAKFIEGQSITITLHEPGNKTSTVNGYAGQQIYLPNATIEADGKVFAGWTTNSNLTSASKPTSAFYEKNVLYTVPATATDLYAVYATASGTEYILTNAASITQGEYVLTDKDYKVATGTIDIENENGGDLIVTGAATVSDNKITTLPEGAAICTLAGNNEDGFTILFEAGYLGYMSTTANRNLAFKEEFSTIKWIAEADADNANGLTLYSSYGENGKYRISTNGSGNTTIRGYNNGNSYGVLYLFKETSSYSDYTTSVTLQLTMAFEKEVYTVRYGETFETPELQTNYAVTGITYSSSEPTVASVNPTTGEITVGEIGQTTITATHVATSEYSAASASYILKVVSPNVDIITSAELTATSTQYKEFEHVGTVTGTTYIGKTAKKDENIQISDDGTRGDGIVSIKSKGYIRSITITFVTSDKQVDIYGSELPYNSSKDLYDNNTRGASLGSLMASGGENTKTLTIADDINIPHIGIRAKNGAVQIEEIAIEWEMYDLVREVNKGYYGTICLKNNVVKYDGATFFKVAGKEDNKLVFDEVTELEAGKPYIFLAESDELIAIYGTETATEAGKHNSLQGTFTQIDPAVDNILVGNYMLVNNIIKKCGINCGLYANRAYFVADDLEKMDKAPAAAPGRRRISLNVTSENTTTGLDNITNGENTTIKVIENGQLIIIRNGEKFNAQGVRL